MSRMLALVIAGSLVAQDYTEARRGLKSKIAVYHQFNNSLNDSARSGQNLASGSHSFTTGPMGEANGAITFSADKSTGRVVGFNCQNEDDEWSFCMWVYTPSLAGSETFIDFVGTASAAMTLARTTTGLYFAHQGTATGGALCGVLNVGWNYVEVVCEAGTIHTYLNRVAGGTTTPTTGGTIAAFTGLRYWNGATVSRFMYAHGALTEDERDYWYNSGNGRNYSDVSSVSYGISFNDYYDSLKVSGDGAWKSVATSGSSNANSAAGSVSALTAAGSATMVSATLPPGISGSGAMNHDGLDDRWTHTGGTDFTSGDRSLTQAIFVKFDAFAANRIVWQTGTVSSSSVNYRGLYVSTVSGSAGNIDAFCASNAGATLADAATTGFPMSTGTWYHAVSLLQDGNAGASGSTMKLMLNGVVHKMSNMGARVAAVNLTQNAIGARPNGSSPMDGVSTHPLMMVARTPKVWEMTKLYDLAMGL